jgi:hypothetical protein
MNINKAQVFTGLVALFLGFMVYTLRSPAAAWFVPACFSIDRIFPGAPSFIRVLAYSFPDFIHPFAFSLITSGLICSDNRAYQALICVSWLTVEIFFEFGQYFKESYLGLIPTWFDTLPHFLNPINFFRNGTFDIFDILAICGGTVFAFCVLYITSRRREEEQ